MASIGQAPRWIVTLNKFVFVLRESLFCFIFSASQHSLLGVKDSYILVSHDEVRVTWLVLKSVCRSSGEDWKWDQRVPERPVDF
jgi:hypothetical protein